MSEQELLLYSIMTGCGLFLFINPTFKMAKERKTPERIRNVRLCGLACAVVGGIMMIRYFL